VQHALSLSLPARLLSQSITLVMPALGSSSGSGGGSSSGGRSPQPVIDVAMARDEVKARLASIPVYTVANPKNEFVLVAGEVSSHARQGRCAANWHETEHLTGPSPGPSAEQHPAGLLLPQGGGRRGAHRQGGLPAALRAPFCPPTACPSQQQV
jgi:hypothetical protein